MKIITRKKNTTVKLILPDVIDYNMPFYKQGNFELIESNYLDVDYKPIQYKFPKSKKKRIRAKWAKRSCNYRIMKIDRVIRIGNKLIVSSKVYKQMEEYYNKNKNAIVK